MTSWDTACKKGSWIRAAAVPSAGGPPAPRCRHRCRRQARPRPTPVRPGLPVQRAGVGQELLDPRAGLTLTVAPRPKQPQRPEQVRQRPAVLGQIPAHRGGQVARLGLQPLEPFVLARAAQRPVRLLSQRPVVLSVAVPNLDGVRPGRQPFGHKLPHGLQHPRPRPELRAVGIDQAVAASASDSSSARSSPTPATWEAAWMVQPFTNTAVTSSSDRSGSSSRPTLHCTAARRVRWRSGRSTGPVPSASSDAVSRSRRAVGSSSRVRAAASSIARGRPSSRRPGRGDWAVPDRKAFRAARDAGVA